MNPVRRAVIAQIALAIYLQVIEWIPLFPWNDIARGNGQEQLDIILGAVSAFLIFATMRRWLVFMAIAVVANAVWLWLQIDSWWRPYLFGATPRELRVYQVWFGKTTKLLPSYGNHPVPDGAHVVMQVLIVLACVTTARAFLQLWRARKA